MYADLHTLTATPTLSQNGLNDLQLQIFIELQENLQEQWNLKLL